VKRFGSAVSRVIGRRSDPAAGDRAQDPAAALHTETADGVRLIRSPYEDPPEAAGVPWRSLRAGSGCVTVVVGAAAAADTELWPVLGDVLDCLVEEGVEEVRLTLAGAAARQGDGRPSVAQRVADAWDLHVTAADGSVVVVPDGSLFTAAESPGAAWHRFGPGGRVEGLGPRHPAPAWQAAYDRLPHHLDDGCVVEPVPAGVLVRGERDAPPGPGGLPYAVPPDGDHPLVLVGSVRGRPVPASAVAELLAALPGAVRDATRLAPATHRDLLPIAQEVADLLGVQVEVLTGLPLAAEDDESGGGVAITLTDAAGRPTWRPTVSAVGCLPARPGERPRPPHRARLRSPLTSGRLEPDGTVGLSDLWRLTLTRSGGVVEARTQPPSHPAVRPVDPERFAVEVRWQGARTDPSLLRACEVLLNDLHPQLRCCAELRVGRLAGDALRDATRLAVRHGVALTQMSAAPGGRPGPIPPAVPTVPTVPTGPTGPTVPTGPAEPADPAGHRPPGTVPGGGPAPEGRPLRTGRSREVLAALTGGDDGRATAEGPRAERPTASDGPAPAGPPHRAGKSPEVLASLTGGDDRNATAVPDAPGVVQAGTPRRPSGNSAVSTGTGTGRDGGAAPGSGGSGSGSGDREARTADRAGGSGPRPAALGDRRGSRPSPGHPAAGPPEASGPPSGPGATQPPVVGPSDTARGDSPDGNPARSGAPLPESPPGTGPAGRRTGRLGERPPVSEEEGDTGAAARPAGSVGPAGIAGSIDSLGISGPAGPEVSDVSDVSSGSGAGPDGPRAAEERAVRPPVSATQGSAGAAVKPARPASLAGSAGASDLGSGPGPAPALATGSPAGSGDRAAAQAGDDLSAGRTGGVPAARVTAPARATPLAVSGPPTAQDRAAFRELVGGVWDRHVFAVSRALVRMPALRGARVDEATCDLLAVHLYLTAPEEEPFAPRNLDEALREQDSTMLPYAACLAAGLRRLPSYRGVALRGTYPEVTHTPGGVLRTGSPVGALPLAAAAGRTPDCALWAVTARRTKALLGPDAEDLVLFLPGTEFDILDAADGDGSAPPVLLAERMLGPAGEAAAPTAAERSRRMVSERLHEALRDLPAARTGTSPEWPRHCQGEVR
jgi:hypothetical protein